MDFTSEVANEGVRLSSDDFSTRCRHAIREVLRIAENPEDASRLSQYLSSLDWQQIVTKKRQEEIDNQMSAKKSYNHPDNLGKIFSPEVIERVRSYLQGERQKCEPPPHVATGRELVIIN